jgi:hypothetical protein
LIGTGTLVTVGDGSGTEVNVGEMDVMDEARLAVLVTVMGKAEELGCNVEIRVGDGVAVLRLKMKNRITKRMATINLKRS